MNTNNQAYQQPEWLNHKGGIIPNDIVLNLQQMLYTSNGGETWLGLWARE